MQLKMKTDESEHKIQDLEAENQALKQKLFQEDEQLQHEIKEIMHRREGPLVTSGSKEENKAVSEKVQCCFVALLSTSGVLYLVVCMRLVCGSQVQIPAGLQLISVDLFNTLLAFQKYTTELSNNSSTAVLL